MKIIGEVEVKKAVTATRTLQGRSGSFKITEQEGFVRLGEEVRKILLTLESDQAAYPVGKYRCDTVMGVNQYGALVAPRSLNLAAVK